MTVVYDNWERLVTAILRREQLRQSALRTPSDLSAVSAESTLPSFNFSSNYAQPLSFFVGDSFTYLQILKATDCLNDSNLIKRGHSGDLYFGVLESGIEVVVKKVHASSLGKELCIIPEMEFCGMLDHSRLISLLGYCLENANQKFLVYKYMPNKDLSRFLNGDGDPRSASIDWTTRMKIAIGAAEGLCYLHHEFSPPFVHRGIQASSILLDDQFEVHLGSLAEVCVEKKDTDTIKIPRFLQLSWDFERSNSGASNATCAYDVCCFGTVLLELVTGKLSTDSIKKDWVTNTLRHIVPHDKKLITNIVDSSLILDEHLVLEVWAVACVAKSCLSPKPSKRPKMAEILNGLEHIRLARLTGTKLDTSEIKPTDNRSSVASVPGGSTVIRNQRFSAGTVEVYPKGQILALPILMNFTFLELTHATRNFRVKLGQDEFGRIYGGLLHNKSMSENGSKSMIVVKRMFLKSEQGGFEQWQPQVEMLGRLSHPNLLKVLGYCWEDNELLLVYKFIQERSLKNYLFRRGSAIPWDRRLKIATGAARGLAFLHESEMQGFFHQKKERGGFYGYFKCSKILIDSDYEAKITGFGVAEVDPPVDVYEVHPRKFMSRVDEYAAPEYKMEGNLLLESDVYGFGVVLVRLLTGRENYHPSQFTDLEPLKFIGEKIDLRLKRNFPIEAAVVMAQLAQSCLQQDLKLRPSMKQVVQILEGIEKIPSS